MRPEQTTQKRLVAAITTLRMVLKKQSLDPTMRSVLEDTLLELQDELSSHKARMSVQTK